MKITKSKLKQIITEELYNVLAEQEDDIGTTRMFEPGERAAMKRARALAKTTKAKASPRPRSRFDTFRRRAAVRTEQRERALALMDTLYPDATNREMVMTLRQYDDEGNLTDNLFGFLFPGETKMNKPSSSLMDMSEEWIATFDDPQDAALEVKGRSNTENLESLLTYIEKKSYEIGKAEFHRVMADRDSRQARNVPVGRSATPGTQEYDALQALMKVDTPPKRRR